MDDTQVLNYPDSDTLRHIRQTVTQINGQLPSGCRLVAVSKYHPASYVQAAYDVGQRVFGESRVQELQFKHETLPKDIEWHFIGHLQTNKVKYIAPYVSMIHAVDSERLLTEISRQGILCKRKIPCLLQIHVAQEETKYGFHVPELMAFLSTGTWRTMEGVNICGIMCMASNTDNMEQVRNEFHIAYSTYQKVKELYFPEDTTFRECSWGMSHDYAMALTQGSTLVRIGSMIFGDRV